MNTPMASNTLLNPVIAELCFSIQHLLEDEGLDDCFPALTEGLNSYMEEFLEIERAHNDFDKADLRNTLREIKDKQGLIDDIRLALSKEEPEMLPKLWASYAPESEFMEDFKADMELSMEVNELIKDHPEVAEKVDAARAHLFKILPKNEVPEGVDADAIHAALVEAKSGLMIAYFLDEQKEGSRKPEDIGLAADWILTHDGSEFTDDAE